MNNIELSIVATIYNDERIVPELVNEIDKHLESLGIKYEIILVNDGSRDESEQAIASVCSTKSHVKGVSLSRNFGQQIAISSGLRYVTGQYVVIMDGDLQNPPSEIPKLLTKIKEGYDIVYAVSKIRNGFVDEFTSRVFWLILTKAFNVQIIQDQLMLKIMTRSYVSLYNKYNEINRTVEGIVSDIGLNHAVIEVKNEKRKIGKSNYTFKKRLDLMIDIVISLSNAPLNFMIYFGAIVFSLTILFSIYYLMKYLFSDIQPGYTSIILSIFLFGGMITFLLGFIGRYLSNIYTEVKNRPLFNIKKTFNI
jgi:glycosyltransferase involved in cell wall biosynthesis